MHSKIKCGDETDNKKNEKMRTESDLKPAKEMEYM